MNRPLDPPSIDGFSHVGWLGGGGFADVYLYNQHFPHRQVAVKVLREGVDSPEVRSLFESEANLMAKVAEHPFIVTVHAVGTSGSGRPYLVMDYYRGSNYGQRMQDGEIDVAEVLSVGVKMAGAVEFAHRAGVVHRDIKPANILANDFGEPGLTDFGISAAHTGTDTNESVGFSPAYAPREVLLDENPGDQLSDVYSLAATLWAMLEGHSPFERLNERNTHADITSRALNSGVPALRRVVPQQLELLLRQAMSPNRADRPRSAGSLGLALREVEASLGYRPTNLPLPQERTAKAADTGEDATRIGRGVVVSPQAPTAPTSPRPPQPTSSQPAPPPPPGGMITGLGGGLLSPGAPSPRLTVPPPPTPPADPGTAVRTPRAQPPAPPAAEPAAAGPRSRLVVLGAVLAALVVAAVLGVVFLGSGSDGSSAATTTTAEVDGFGTVDVALPPDVESLVLTRDHTGYLISWAAQDGDVDEYVVVLTAGDSTFDAIRTADTSVHVDQAAVLAAAKDFGLCTSVTARNGAGESSPAKKCVAAG